MKVKSNTLGLLLLSMLLIVLAIMTAGCTVTGQANVTVENSATLPIQTPETKLVTNNNLSFSLSDLTIEPRAPAIGAFFSISVAVTNIGKSQGKYEACLYLNELCTDDPYNVNIISTKTFNKSAIIAQGQSEIIIFDSLILEKGVYTATIGDLEDYIRVGC